MGHHDQLALAEIELPAKGNNVPFWAGGEQYTIRADQDTAWHLYGPARFGRLPILGYWVTVPDGYAIFDEREGLSKKVTADWRQLVRQLM